MADDYALPKMSGRLNLPYHTFAFFEIVPSAFFVIIIIIIIIIIYPMTLVKISNVESKVKA